MDKYVRLTPYNKRVGAVVRNLVYKGKKFTVGNWYQVSADLASELEALKQPNGFVPMFGVYSPEEAKGLAQAEREAALTGLSDVAVPVRAPGDTRRVGGRRTAKAGAKAQGAPEAPVEVDPAPNLDPVAVSAEADAGSVDPLADSAPPQSPPKKRRRGRPRKS